MAQGTGAPGAELRDYATAQTEPTPREPRSSARGMRVFWLLVVATAAALAVLITLTVLQGRQVDQMTQDPQGVVQQGGYGSRGEVPDTFFQPSSQHQYGSRGEIPATFFQPLSQHQYGSRGEMPDTFLPAPVTDQGSLGGTGIRGEFP